MAFLNSLNISGSALTAQKLRMDILAENVANIDTTRTADGTPYRRKMVVFSEKYASNFNFELRKAFTKVQDVDSRLSKMTMGDPSEAGVIATKVVEDPTELTPKYDPTHPDADEYGYVYMPNVDTTKEMIDMMAASRAYEANITVFNGVKSMATRALDLGK